MHHEDHTEHYAPADSFAQKENAPPLWERRSESSKQKGALQSKLDILNNELRYSGHPELRACLCDGDSIDSLSEVIRGLLAELARQTRRNKQLQQEGNDERIARQQRSREKHTLAGEREALMRERDGLQEKLARQGREQRQRDEKWARERDSFAKEKRGLAQREDALRSQSRTLEEKARQLEERLKKVLQKNDKTEFRNSFEVLAPLPRPERSMLQREYEQGVANSIEQHTRALEEENEELRETLKEVFGRLQRIAKGLDSEQRGLHRPEVVDLPSPRTHCLTLLRTFLSAIESRAAELAVSPSRQSCDPAELLQTVGRLKSFYAGWEAVNESRKGLLPGLLRVALEHGRLSKLAELAEFAEGEDVGEEEGEAERYVAERMSYFGNEMKHLSRWKARLEAAQGHHSQGNMA